jgi:nicotinamidase-related amidase
MIRPKSALMVAAILCLMFVMSACEGENANVNRGPGTALVLIDLQTDYLSPDGKMPIAQNQAGPLIKAANSLIQAARAQAFPVVYAMNQVSHFDFWHIIKHGTAAMRYSPGQLIDPQVDSVAGPYFAKSSQDAFCNSEFSNHLDALDSGNLVVAGVYADKSVLATVKTAIANGYKVTVISDAVGSSSDQARDTALDELKTAGAKVETSAEFLATVGAPTATAAIKG